MARWAGMYTASPAIAAIIRVTIAIVLGSFADNPNNWLETRRVKARASARPAPRPPMTGVMDSRITSHSNARGRAHNAARIPISAVRCAATYDMTP